MRNSNAALIAWSAASIIAALLIIYFSFSIRSQNDDGLSQQTEAGTAEARQDANIRLHSLARDTKSDRDELERMISIDLLAIAGAIEGVGDIAGVDIKIKSVLPDAAKQSQNTKDPEINEADLIVETEGPFPSLMHAVSLFETLPIVSSIQSLELERMPSPTDAKKALWMLSARIRVLTTRNI